MSPPNLSTDAPVLNVFKPAEPFSFKVVRSDDELFLFDEFDQLLADLLAVYVPLWLEHGFDNVVRSEAIKVYC